MLLRVTPFSFDFITQFTNKHQTRLDFKPTKKYNLTNYTSLNNNEVMRPAVALMNWYDETHSKTNLMNPLSLTWHATGFTQQRNMKIKRTEPEHHLLLIIWSFSSSSSSSLVFPPIYLSLLTNKKMNFSL